MSEQRTTFSIVSKGGRLPDNERADIERRNLRTKQEDYEANIVYNLAREADKQTALLLNPGVVAFVRDEPIYSPNCFVQMKYRDARRRVLQELT